MPDQSKVLARWILAGVLAVAALAAIFFKIGGDSPGAVATSMAVQVPAAIATAIQIGVIALLTAGFTWLFNVFGIDLRGQASVLGLVLSTWIVGELQNIVNVIPAQFDPYVMTFFYLLTLILAPAGALFLLKKRDNEPHKLM